MPRITSIRSVHSTGSTNADILADPTFPTGTLLVAHHQNAGRGRYQRAWVAPPGTHLAISLLLRPTPAEVERLGLVPLAAGVALTDLIPQARLKWPNDTLLGGKKVAGILAEADFSAPRYPRIALGIGLNTSIPRDQLPTEHATSLQLHGETRSEQELLDELRQHLSTRLQQWEAGDPALLDDYRAVCSTLGQRIRIETPTGVHEAVAVDVSPEGTLICQQGERTVEYAAGDVTHLRAPDGSYPA